MPNFNVRAVRPDLYIMRAYHIYEEVRAPRLSNLVADSAGGYILFGRRDDGKGKSEANWPAVAARSAGRPSSNEVEGARLTYTIDTGMGYRCQGYSFIVDGWAAVDDRGQIVVEHGKVPALNDKVNAYVFK